MGQNYAVTLKAKVVTDEAELKRAYEEVGKVINKSVDELKEQQRVTSNIKKENGEIIRTVISGNSVYKQITYNNNAQLALKKQILKKEEELERKLKQINNAQYNIKMSAKDELDIRNKLDALKSVNLVDENDLSVLRSYNNELKDINDQFRNATKSSGSFSDKIKESLTTLLSWHVAAKGIRYAVDTVVELDGSLTELNKVLNLSKQELKDVTAQAYEMSTVVGRTGKDVVDAMAEFAKAGYSATKSLELAENALLWQNVSDGMIDASESANMIIAALKAFDKQGITSRHVIDALNAVSNNYAVTSSDLSEAIGISASSMVQAGASFEEFLGLLTAGTEITRDANKTANALRTISLRLQGMTDEGEKDLELTAKLGPALKKIGVEITDSEGNLRSVADILKDVASGWNELDNATQAYYTELMAGKNRANVLAAILSNFNTAINATETAMNSAGSAMKENAAYLDSIEGKWNLLQSQLQKMVTEGSLGEIIKDLLDLARAALEVTEAIGGLKVVITAFAALKILKNIGGEGGISAGIETLRYQLSLLKLEFKSAGGGAAGFAKAAKTAASSISGVGVVVSAAVIGVTALVKRVNYLSKEYERNAEAVRKANSEYEASKTEMDEVKSKIKEIDDKIKNLNKDKLDITTGDTLEELESQRKELKRILEVKEAIAAGKKTEASEKAKKALTGKGSLTKSQLEEAGVDTSEFGISKIGKLLSWTGMDFSLLGLGWRIGEKFIPATSQLKEAQALIDANYKLQDQLAEQEEEYSKLDTTSKDFVKLEKKKKKEIDNTRDALKQNKAFLGTVMETINEYGDSLDENDETTKSYKTAIGSLNAQYVGLTETLDSVSDEQDKINKNSEATVYTLDDAIKTILSSKDAYNDLSAAVSEYQKNGSLSAKTLATLMSKHPGYLKGLEEDGFSLDNVNKMLRKSADEQLNSAESTLINARATAETTIKNAELALSYKDLKYNIAGYQEMLSAIGNVPTAVDRLKEIDEQQKRIDQLRKSLEKFDFSGGAGTGKDLMQTAFEKEYNALKHQLAMNYITQKDYTDSLEALYKKYFADRTKYLDNYNKYEEEVYKNRKSIFKEEVSDVEHQIELLSNREGTYSERISLYKQLQEKIHAQAEYYRSLGERENKEAIQELQTQWWKYADQIEKLYDDMANAYEDMLQKQIDAQEKQIDKLNNVASVAQSAIDNEISRLQKEKELLEETNDSKEKEIELEKLRNNLYNARNQRNMRVYYAGRGWVWQSNKKDVEEAEKALSDFENKQRIEKIDDEISELNNLKEEWANVADTYEKNQNKIEASLVMGNNFEADVLNKRLSTLKNFVRRYNSEMDKLTSAQKDLESEQEARSASKKAQQTRDVYYDKDTDYQELINQALVRGASKSELAALEAKRNAKIRGEGLPYEETHYYSKGYNNGGIVDYTGLASMHGTSARPEIVLNNSQAASLYNMIRTMRQPSVSSNFPAASSNKYNNVYNINMYEVDKMNEFVSELKQYMVTHKNLI